MLLQRTAAALTRRATISPPLRRAFTAGAIRRSDHAHAKPSVPSTHKEMRNIDRRMEDIDSEADLMPEGAKPGTIPTDVEQATGLERLEIIGKMQGVDIFDMKPLPSDRHGTLKDPVMVKSFGEEQYCGCTGVPADSHVVKWLRISRDRPLGRCVECGSCYMMEYVGPEHVHHGERPVPTPKTFADYVKPEYYYK